MNWITVLWSMLASASLTFALLHLFILGEGHTAMGEFIVRYCRRCCRRHHRHGIDGDANDVHRTNGDTSALDPPPHSRSFGGNCLASSAVTWQAGRSWLAWTGIGLRVLALILSFTTGQNLFFNEITGLKQVALFGGETISIAQGTLNPWYVVRSCLAP